MSARELLRYTVLVLGVLMGLLGLAGIGFYIAGVVEVVIENPSDRSWLFWGLGLAGVGGTLLAGGIGLFVIGRSMGSDHEN